MYKTNLCVTIDKLFVRVATHKTDIGRDISTELIVFYFYVYISTLIYIYPNQTIFDIFWISFKTATNCHNLTEVTKETLNTIIIIMISTWYYNTTDSSPDPTQKHFHLVLCHSRA